MASFHMFKNCYLNELKIPEKNSSTSCMLMNIIELYFFHARGNIYFGIVIKEEVYIEVSSFITEKKSLYMEDSSFITTKCARVWLQLECQLASLSAVPTIYLLDISGNFSQGHKLRLIEACRS